MAEMEQPKAGGRVDTSADSRSQREIARDVVGAMSPDDLKALPLDRRLQFADTLSGQRLPRPERQALTKVIGSLPLLKSYEDDMRAREQAAIGALRGSAELERAKSMWPEMTIAQKQDALQKILDIENQAMGYERAVVVGFNEPPEKVPDRKAEIAREWKQLSETGSLSRGAATAGMPDAAPPRPRLDVETQDADTGAGGTRMSRGMFKQGFGRPEVHINTHPDGPLKSLGEALETARHENRHAQQMELGYKAQVGRLDPQDPRYTQARIFAAVNKAGPIRPDEDYGAYRAQVTEVDARAGAARMTRPQVVPDGLAPKAGPAPRGPGIAPRATSQPKPQPALEMAPKAPDFSKKSDK